MDISMENLAKRGTLVNEVGEQIQSVRESEISEEKLVFVIKIDLEKISNHLPNTKSLNCRIYLGQNVADKPWIESPFFVFQHQGKHQR